MILKRKTKQFISGLLTVVTLLSTAFSPAVAYASEIDGSDKSIPLYGEVKDQLNVDEVVVANDIEISMGSDFDVKADFSGIEISDESKVKVKFVETQHENGKAFSTDHEDSYKAIYYVEPQTTDHPTYQINRMIEVKNVSVEADGENTSDNFTEQDVATDESELSSEDGEGDSESLENIDEEDAVETEVSGTLISEDEFDAEIAATEEQETVDPETGITLSEVLEEATEQEVAFGDLEAGESVEFEMPESSYHTAVRLNKKWQENNIGEIRMIKTFKYHGKLYVFYKDGKNVS